MDFTSLSQTKYTWIFLKVECNMLYLYCINSSIFSLKATWYSVNEGGLLVLRQSKEFFAVLTNSELWGFILKINCRI